METIYAQALLKAIQAGTQPKKAVQALADLLKREGRIALLPRIGKAFERLATREAQRSAVVLTVAHERDARSARADAKHVLESLAAEKDDVEVRVDGSLIGGWRLEGRGTLVDASYKKSLLDMYNRATTNV